MAYTNDRFLILMLITLQILTNITSMAEINIVVYLKKSDSSRPLNFRQTLLQVAYQLQALQILKVYSSHRHNFPISYLSFNPLFVLVVPNW